MTVLLAGAVKVDMECERKRRRRSTFSYKALRIRGVSLIPAVLLEMLYVMNPLVQSFCKYPPPRVFLITPEEV